ncbi:MAG: Rrf2 family transcriptional regulator [Planctomycetes bacterium]|nr:Rrf2 family transcriptional regulator [Planctomycetota bacterium]
MFGLTSQYAVRAVMHIAKSGGWCSKRDIATAAGVASGYMSKVLQMLVDAGILVSHRGFKGGYRLSRPPEQVTVHDILQATETDGRLTTCSACQLGHPALACAVNRLLTGVRQDADHRLRQTTIRDLLASCSPQR